MGTAIFDGDSDYRIDVDASVLSQNQSGWYSTIYWRIIVVKTAGVGFASVANSTNSGWANSSHSGANGLWTNPSMAYNFQNGQSTGSFTIIDGTFDVPHDSSGNATYFVNGGLRLSNLGYANAGTGTRSIPSLMSTPQAPTPLGLDNIMTTSMRYGFSSNGTGGTPILEWQIGYGTDPATQTTLISSNGSTDINNLQPAVRYYFWSRGRNNLGWGPWSSRIDARTIAGARILDGTVWKEAIPYVKVNGVWKVAQPYIKTAGIWKATI